MQYPKSELKDDKARIIEARDRGPKTKRIKKTEADERNKAWSNKCPIDQIKYLDKLFGKNCGAKKQRAKILEKIRGKKDKKNN